ncbi:MAG: glycosyltransferase family A protein [Desulfuromusa sp.]|nr:glycosyltransferase family A protein [Desulfuromusa sp.]
MKNLSVSIVVPAYNAEKFVVETLGSVQEQSYKNWELILVDDGSTDQTAQVVERFLAETPCNMRIMSHPHGENRGTSASRNLGLQQATGDLICFLDADDVWQPTFLEFFVEKFSRFPDLAMAYGPCLYWHPERDDAQQRGAVQSIGCAGGVVASETLFRLFLEYENSVPSPSGVMIRLSRLVEVGGWEDDFRGMFDDQVLYSKLFLLGSMVYIADQPLYYYRQHDESLCQRAIKENRLYESRKNYLAWLRAYVGRAGLSASAQLKKVDEQATLLEVRSQIDRQLAIGGSKCRATWAIFRQLMGLKNEENTYFNCKVVRYGLNYLAVRLFATGKKA